jgi:hypothetical protein
MAKKRTGSSTTKRGRKKATRKTRKASSKARRVAASQAGKRGSKSAQRRTRRRAPAESARGIDVAFKGVLVLEPPRDSSPENLAPEFRTKLMAALADLAGRGTPFTFVEGFRTVERQQWLFGSGRPQAVPFGRAGSIVTKRDGVTKLSNHQGSGVPGSGRGADCYPTRDGRVFIPPASDPLWRAYADAVKRQGLQAGLDFPSFPDAPHCELV